MKINEKFYCISESRLKHFCERFINADKTFFEMLYYSGVEDYINKGLMSSLEFKVTVDYNNESP